MVKWIETVKSVFSRSRYNHSNNELMISYSRLQLDLSKAAVLSAKNKNQYDARNKRDEMVNL